MARNYTTERNTAIRESVDSCFDEAFCISSNNTLSNETSSATEHSSQTISRTSLKKETMTSEFTAVDSCFDEAFCISSNDTLSNETSSATEHSSQTISRTSLKDDTMTSEFTAEDPSTSFTEVSSIERVELRPTKRRGLAAEPVGDLTLDIASGNFENRTITPCYTLDESVKMSCKKMKAGTSNSLEESNSLPILAILQKSISRPSGNSEEENNDHILHDLYMSYYSNPLEFTDHLLTIIEESDSLSMSGTSKASCSLMGRFGQTDSTHYMSLKKSGSGEAEKLDSHENFVSPETAGNSNVLYHFREERGRNNTPMVWNPSNKTCTKTPKIYGIPKSSEKRKTIERSQTSLDSEETQRSSNSSMAFGEYSSTNFDNVTYRKTSKIRRDINEKSSTRFGDNGTLESSNRSITFEDYYSIVSNVSDESYTKVPEIILIPATPKGHDLIVEHSTQSEADPENTTLTETEESKDETINLSKLSSRHKDWVEMFEKRKETNAACTKKLEQRWLRQLLKKREKCFATIKRLIENTAAAAKHEECTCDNCIVMTDFYKTMLVCDDYCTSANWEHDHRSPSKADVKRKRRSVSRSSRKSTNRELSSGSQVTCSRPTKKVSRKSIGRKSPSGKPKSPRLSIVVKHNMRSPLRSTGSRSRVRPMAEIDYSSIRPVAQLRKVFSPLLKKSDSTVTTIPLPQKVAPRTFVTKCLVSTSVPRTSPNNKCCFNGSSNSKNFRHVKSPVGEYIRGTKTIKKKDAATQN